MPTTEVDQPARVELVQLAPGIAPAAFEAAIRARAPAMAGSLLGWVHDDWYSLAADVRPALAGQDQPALATLQAAGAVGLQRIDAPAFADLMSLRDAQAGASSARLRDRQLAADVFIDPPEFWWPGDYQGRAVKLDWHLAATGIPQAWAQLAPLGPAAYADIRVGHIDTGYTEHPALGFSTPAGTWLKPELGHNLWKDRLDGQPVSDDPDRWRATPESSGPLDNLSGSHGGHGTRTCSVLAGLYAPADGSTDHPFFGAAPGAPVIPYRITDSVLIDHVPDLLARAIADAVAQGARVLSISLGALRRSQRVARALGEAYRQGVIVCAAAGQPLPMVIYPGRFATVITCGGATTTDGHDFLPWRPSARGPDVDICGPADRIRRATTVLSAGAPRYLVTGPGDGTSFATALCAGIAVLWLAKRGSELEAAYGTQRWARVAAFKHLLQATAQVPAGWPTDTYGAGIYQAGALLEAELPPLGSLQAQHDD